MNYDYVANFFCSYFIVVLNPFYCIFLLFLFSITACESNEHLNPKDAYFKTKFNDVQSKQLPTAKRLGVKPMQTKEAIYANSKLVKVRSGTGYKIASLSHSVAKVMPKTKQLIQDIGQQFRDSVQRRNLRKERIVITSLTRSKSDQKKLSKGNLNAANHSAHFYGTTFDISYIRFASDINAKRDILGNVLENLRKQKRCWVKYEIQQKCFHITVRS